MAYQTATGLKRIINAAHYSAAGFKATWAHEEAFRQEVILFLLAAPTAFFVGKSAVEIVLLVSSVIVILLVVLLNSAVEAAVDRIGFEHHELSGRAKDIGSAAVMLSILGAAATWLIILFY